MGGNMPDASWGYTAQQGLEAVLGGKDIDKINRREGAMTPEEMRTYILAAPDVILPGSPTGYEDESRRFAKTVLLRAERDKEKFLAESQAFARQILKDAPKDEYDLTGFMFGWATNAVRYTFESSPEQNPAIIEIDGKVQ